MNLCAGLVFINEGLFHCDSVALARAVEVTYQTGQLQPAVAGRYGAVIINSILYFPFFLLGDNADFLTRFSSILFHSLSIVALYLFIVEFLGDRVVALFGALLFSATPLYFMPNTYGKEHGMAMFFFLFSFYSLLRGCRKNSLFWVSLASVFMGISISVRESILVMVPMFVLLAFSPAITTRPFAITIPKEKRELKWLSALFLPLCCVLGTLFFTYLGDLCHRTLFVRDVSVAFYWGLLSPALYHAMYDLENTLGVFGVGCFVMGMTVLFSKENLFKVLFLFIWCMFILFYGNNRCYTPRYLDMIMVPLWIAVAYGIVWVYRLRSAVGIFLLSLFLTGMILFMYPMLVFRHHYNGEKRFAAYVQGVTESNAIILGADDNSFIEYYAKRKTLGIPVNDFNSMDAFLDEVSVYVRQGVPVYLMGSLRMYDEQGIFWKKIAERLNLFQVGKFLAEDFHRPERKLQTYYEGLYRVFIK
jgi:hypothetical protein